MRKKIIFIFILLVLFNQSIFAFGVIDLENLKEQDLNKNTIFQKVNKNKVLQRKRIEIRGHIGLYNPERRVTIPDEHGEGFLIGYYELEEEMGRPNKSNNKIVITDETGQEKIIGFFDKKVSKEIFSDGSFDVIHSEGIHTSNNNNDISYEKHHFNPEEKKTGVTIGVQEGKEVFEETYNMKGEKTKTSYGLIGDNNTIKMYREHEKEQAGKTITVKHEDYSIVTKYDENGKIIEKKQKKTENTNSKKDDFIGFEDSIKEKYENNKLINEDFMKEKEIFLEGNSNSLFDEMGIDGSFHNMKNKIEW